jgi:hypothetical protein
MQSKAPDVGEVRLHELLAEVLAGDPAGGGFEVQYQPIVRLAGGPTNAVEAVARRQHTSVGELVRRSSLLRRACQVVGGACRARRAGYRVGVDATRTEAMCQAVLDIHEPIGVEGDCGGDCNDGAAPSGMGCKIGQAEMHRPAVRLHRVAKTGRSKIAR